MPANSVLAKVHNKNSYEEGFASAALAPGMGCVLEEADGDVEKTVVPASVDSSTARIVRESRNPPQPVADGALASPLTETFDADAHIETVGFNRFDEARVRVADSVAAGDGDLGWTDNSDLAAVDPDTAGEPTAAVATLKRLLTDVSDDFNMALVEFY